MQENGVNLLCLPAKDPYSYGQALLDRLFTKEELGRSLVFPSDKSPKPGLPQEKVNKLFRELQQHYVLLHRLSVVVANKYASMYFSRRI